jgi:hypothetical protein
MQHAAKNTHHKENFCSPNMIKRIKIGNKYSDKQSGNSDCNGYLKTVKDCIKVIGLGKKFDKFLKGKFAFRRKD